jgi:hypothetical protein
LGRRATVKLAFVMICHLAFTLGFAFPGWSQSSANQDSSHAQKTVQEKEKSKGPGKEMGQGGEDIGKGAAKGTADLGKGVAGGVGNLAKGNVGGAGASVGKGVGGFGKNVTVGTAKGVGKIGKGSVGEIKKLGKKSKKKQEANSRFRRSAAYA